MNDVIEILVIARDKIESGWTQSCAARNSRGEMTTPMSNSACEWSAHGAIKSVFRMDDRIEKYVSRFIPQERFSPWGDISDLAVFNDHHETTKSDIIDLFSKAITYLRELEEN